ncbi:non-specific serine/threonine protein kinase [Herbihabitans rhizosphaerae]|uniref:Non-specific serine/threonine protein kinase n=1 Tax=Herbihabitans rhizosphaerae TaxID=1872711 RepID=A0A4Q7KLX8_9PSEU|nr:LuxR C-terminal-related transcriptional regulator [Herbihabitans rhizosphaerae]RZS36571.1 non-specific serine/threonine protein kinase [Herbihabitans rhizosphaerae]
MAAIEDPHGLPGAPVARTSYVGRDHEVTELRALLDAERLVCVVGPPGVGKTRLAVRLAADLAAELPDGGALIELAELRDAGLVANTIAVALGLPTHAGAEPRELLEHLRDRRTLLVLDNCEHLIDACAEIVHAILRECPRVLVLATSRQSLGVTGEHLYPLLPLAVPEPDDVHSPADLDGYDAVSLFVARARALMPSFEVTEDNHRDVARLINGLDGLPLAIELAAVRLRSLSVRQLADRLTTRLSLLAGTPRAGSHRHRSLHGTLEWSFELCTPDERLVWARASVFAGSFDLCTAERVCGGDGVSPAAMMDVITGLVDKSVLIARQHSGENRFHMLETLREYGREHLSAEEAERAGQRHRDHYVARAAHVRETAGTPEGLSACQRLRLDHPNVRAALEYFRRTPGQADAGVAMMTDLHQYWHTWRLLAEARAWLDRLLPDASPGGPRVCLALLYNAAYCVHEGDLDRCDTLVTEATEMATGLGDEFLMSRATFTVGFLAECRGQPGRAAGLFSTAVAGFRAVGNRRGELASLNHLGWSTGFSGDPDGGRRILREGLALSTELGDLQSGLYSLAGLTMIEAEFGEPDVAARTLGELVAAAKNLEVDRWDVEWLSSAGWVAGRRGDHARAATLYGITETACRVQGIAMHTLAAFEAPNARHVRRTREALGEQEFERRFTAGAALSEAEAMLYVFDTPEAIRVPSGADLLTRREREITDLVRQGLTNGQIADRLCISRRTAEKHVANIMNKLDLRRRTQLAAWAVRRPE